jgi:hypothetical protein
MQDLEMALKKVIEKEGVKGIMTELKPEIEKGDGTEAEKEKSQAKRLARETVIA